MTIVVSVKVNDGLVLATDSATTFIDGEGRPIKVYNHANKLFNLVKVWPIGAMTYGSGSIGAASISTLSKDLRHELDPATGLDPAFRLDRATYTVRDVAERAKNFLYARFQAEYPDGIPNYCLGYRVCGYSAGAMLSECWEIMITSDGATDPTPICELDQFGPRWAGETEALDRLLLGVGSKCAEVLQQLGVEQAAANAAHLELTKRLCAQLHLPAMPIQDAIDLAKFLAETAARFAGFSIRAATVGGPIEVATITKHEGFKWVARKHFFSNALNTTG